MFELLSIILLSSTDRTVSVEPSSDQFLISPITGEKIPADKVRQHMRIGMYIYDQFIKAVFCEPLEIFMLLGISHCGGGLGLKAVLKKKTVKLHR